MLNELNIRNFATIDRLQVAFRAGLNVLTGETGAGKSIIIDAVGLLLGDRARPELIRADADEATVEAIIGLDGAPEVVQRLVDEGFEATVELLIRRIVSRSGKNRIYLNGALATLAQLQAIGAELVVIYGQHEQQQLQKPSAHLDMLDRFAGVDSELAACAAVFTDLQRLRERMQALDLAERDRQQRLDLLQFQSQELALAALRPGEDEELALERQRLQHAGRLAEVCAGGYTELYADEEAICGRLAILSAGQEALSSVDPVFAELAEAVRQAQFGLEEVATRLRRYGDDVVFDPQRQSEIEERLALIAVLKRKYAPSLDGILQQQVQIDEELVLLADVEVARTALSRELAQAEAAFSAAAAALTARRQQAAIEIARTVGEELAGLAMERARFEVRLEPVPEPTTKGAERCMFYLSANPGEPPKPLNRIASGGELSRIMLAIRRAIPQPEGTATLIFDEVDAGIGGVAATRVGEKLHGVARGLQVLCVTHLPQVAAFADWHYRVAKQQDDSATRTCLVLLDGEERVREMARMLGGAQVTERTLAHARELVSKTATAMTSQAGVE